MMMTIKNNQFALLLLSGILLSGFTPVSPADDDAATGEPDYLEPNEFNRDDYATITDHKARYNDCLTEKSFDTAQGSNDPRVAVDFAMKECAAILEELDVWMTERNIMPAFRQGYIRRVSNQGANNVLRSVMMSMANREAQSGQE